MPAVTEEELTSHGRHDVARRRVVALALVAVVALVAGSLALWSSMRGTDRMQEARSLTTARHFETPLDAGDALARIGLLLLEEGRACRNEAGAHEPRCASLLTASGYAQVMAAHVLRCTAPGRFEARERIANVLGAVEEQGDGEPVRPPPLPDCR